MRLDVVIKVRVTPYLYLLINFSMLYPKTKAMKINSLPSMYSKSLLIAIAALALSATGAQAFSGDALIRAGLTDSQVAAFEVARELRQDGDTKAARDVLIDAGIDETVIERVRSVLSKNHHVHQTVVMAAVAANDYHAFVTAIANTPLADIVTTRADFARFKVVHDVENEGAIANSDDVFADLDQSDQSEYEERDDDLSDSQKEAMSVALAANDHDAVQAIMEDRGVFKGGKRDHVKFLRDGRQM